MSPFLKAMEKQGDVCELRTKVAVGGVDSNGDANWRKGKKRGLNFGYNADLLKVDMTFALW